MDITLRLLVFLGDPEFYQQALEEGDGLGREEYRKIRIGGESWQGGGKVTSTMLLQGG